MSEIRRTGYGLPIVIIGSLFFVLGFAIGINTYLIPFLREVFNLSTAASYLVMTATFAAFVVFGIPSGFVIRKIGYKGGIVLSFVILALGMILFVPSAKNTSFPLFLLALFIGGAGQTLLQTSINPYITILGPEESAARRICIMGISNKVAFALGPIVLSLFMSLQGIDVSDVVRPFYMISAIFLAGAGISFFAPLPEIQPEQQQKSEEPETEPNQTSIFQFPHLFLGMGAIFFSIGTEGLALGTVLDFATRLDLPHITLFNINIMAPEIFVSYTTFSMIIGYLIGIVLIPKYISQEKALTYSNVVAIIMTGMVLVVPTNLSVFLVAALGMMNALMWPAIWPLSLAGLGKLTKTGSSILVLGIVGGAIIPLIFGWMVDLLSFQHAYWISIPCYLYILYFAVSGHKIRRTK
ncbi:MAG: glucose/galactose MFS transporter [Bacteroidota bacterium]